MLFIRLLICVVIAGVALYKHIDKSNELTELRLAIPSLQKSVNELIEENSRLQYEIHHFESPAHLFELARQPEFRHLKYPSANEVTTVSLPRVDR